MIVLAGIAIMLISRSRTFQAQSHREPTPQSMSAVLDRLAKPTLPANPGQADLGSQAYWLHCMPCHGDRGQGLTREFRLLYPEDHQDCWKSGCHGNRPYTNGWTLPASVPALIGQGTLIQFKTADEVFAFAKAEMPFQDPGSVDDQTYWQIIAYILRQNGIISPTSTLDAQTAPSVTINPRP